MLELEDALQRILAEIQPLATESIPLNEALDHCLAEPVRAPLDLPPFDNSAMDGYAVRAPDLVQCSAQHPVSLQRIGAVAAGEKFEGEVAAGACVRIFTGSPLPRGADAVVMQEDTQADPSDPNRVLVVDTVKPWENIRLQGGDVRKGALLLAPGRFLTPGQLSLLAALGIQHVTCGRRPLIGLLSTGSELREPGLSLAPGQIYESNRVGLAGLVRRAGGLPRLFPLLADDPKATEAAIGNSLAECDAVITSGGVSVGEFDFVKGALTALGGTVNFWQVAVKPGKPFLFGHWNSKPLFGLPGNPVSALVTCFLLVRPALLRMQGAAHLAPPACSGRLAQSLANPGARRHFARVKVDAAGKVESAGGQASHHLGAMVQANGLVDVPPKTVLNAGTDVSVMLWQ